MPFTLSIDPVPADVMERVAALAADVGLAPGALGETAGTASPAILARAHLARAVALGPALLVLEHPTAMVPAGEAPALAADIVRLADLRSLTVIAVTEDARFAGIVAGRRLALDPSTGVLSSGGAGRRWWRGPSRSG